jgi:hypothetical protein
MLGGVFILAAGNKAVIASTLLDAKSGTSQELNNGEAKNRCFALGSGLADNEKVFRGANPEGKSRIVRRPWPIPQNYVPVIHISACERGGLPGSPFY